jgi:hypothetical protein
MLELYLNTIIIFSSLAQEKISTTTTLNNNNCYYGLTTYGITTSKDVFCSENRQADGSQRRENDDCVEIKFEHPEYIAITNYNYN